MNLDYPILLERGFKMDKKAEMSFLVKMVLWIIFFLIAGIVLYFLLTKLGVR